MNKIASSVVAALSVLALGGCASKSYVVLEQSPDGTTGKIVVKGTKGEQIIDKAQYAAPLDGSAAAAPVDAEKFKKDFGDALAARPLLPERFLLYFESGGAKLTAESEALLPTIVANAGRRPGVDVSIIGHTDTVGRADGNEQLALTRARFVAELIKGQGLNVSALSVDSHGERNLLVPTPDETPEPKNRRVEISIR